MPGRNGASSRSRAGARVAAFLFAAGALNLSLTAAAAECHSLSAEKLTQKTKTIFVVRILARVQARERVAYRAQVVQTLKGKRVEELSFDLTSPMPKFPKDKFTFVQLPNCEMRGNLVADSLYVVYPAELSNPHAIVPVSTMDDVEIDRVEAWVHPKPKPE